MEYARGTAYVTKKIESKTQHLVYLESDMLRLFSLFLVPVLLGFIGLYLFLVDQKGLAIIVLGFHAFLLMNALVFALFPRFNKANAIGAVLERERQIEAAKPREIVRVVYEKW